LREDELQFSSDFESGNLDMAVQIGENEYDLFLRVNSNTGGYTGWFYFEVSNTRRNQKVRFNILNMTKTESPYGRGMRINYWSKPGNHSAFQGWQLGAHDIGYARTKTLKNRGQAQVHDAQLRLHLHLRPRPRLARLHHSLHLQHAHPIPQSRSGLSRSSVKEKPERA